MDSTVPRRGPGPGQLTALHLPESAADLAALGFAEMSGSDAPRVGQTRLLGDAMALGARIEGIDELDGLVMAEAQPCDATGSSSVASTHPNGVESIDHIVVMTPNADRTHAAFEARGLEARRVRRIETPKGIRRQTFFWLGDVICEVGGADDGRGDDPATWWGLALTVRDVDATAAFYGDHASDVKDAVQPGRRVCTLRSPRSTTPVLFISPHVKS